MIFKYLKHCYATKMASDGCVRIGTLYEYRDVEKLGTSVGDPEEGIKSATVRGPLIVTKQEEVPPVLHRAIHVQDGGCFHSLKNITVQEHSPDCLVYCVSTTLSKKIAREFNVDTCVKISDSDLFFQCISKEIAKKGHFEGPVIRKCTYRSRHVDHKAEDFMHPVFIKSPQYEGQSEVRAVWMPPNTKVDLDGMIITCPEIIGLCEIHEFDKA